MIFLPLMAELADVAMRQRHWSMIKEKFNLQANIDEDLILRDIFNLNPEMIQEYIEEITHQAK